MTVASLVAVAGLTPTSAAVTRTVILLPCSAGVSLSFGPAARLTARPPANHRYVSETPAGVHAPALARSVDPTTARPLITGEPVLATTVAGVSLEASTDDGGASCGPAWTTGVGDVVVERDSRSARLAVTLTEICLPASPATTVYEDDVALAIGDPFASH